MLESIKANRKVIPMGKLVSVHTKEGVYFGYHEGTGLVFTDGNRLLEPGEYHKAYALMESLALIRLINLKGEATDQLVYFPISIVNSVGLDLPTV